MLLHVKGMHRACREEASPECSEGRPLDADSGAPSDLTCRHTFQWPQRLRAYHMASAGIVERPSRLNGMATTNVHNRRRGTERGSVEIRLEGWPLQWQPR